MMKYYHICISKSKTRQWTSEPSGTGRKTESVVYRISGKTDWPRHDKCS